MNGHRFNRRIGDRLPIVIDGVEWRPCGTPRRRLLRRGAPAVQVARIVELSVTGAGIVGPADPPLARGAQVQLRIHGVDGLVEIRRVQPTDAPDLARYGVAFVRLHPELERFVSDAIGNFRPEDIDTWWSAAQ